MYLLNLLSQLGELRLRELYCEANPLLPMVPVPAEQQEEVLSLRVRGGEREGEGEGGGLGEARSTCSRRLDCL